MAETGISSLYTGLSASLLRQMSYSLVRLGTYESIKSKMTNPSSAELLAAAAFAGACGAWAGNPAGTQILFLV